jgi:hypothetical protein
MMSEFVKGLLVAAAVFTCFLILAGLALMTTFY